MTMTRVSQIWDLIETWGFHKNIKEIIGDEDGDNDNDDKDNKMTMTRKTTKTKQTVKSTWQLRSEDKKDKKNSKKHLAIPFGRQKKL